MPGRATARGLHGTAQRSHCGNSHSPHWRIYRGPYRATDQCGRRPSPSRLAARKPLTRPEVKRRITHLATPEDEDTESFLIFHARMASSRCFVMKGLGSSVSMSAKVWLTSRWWLSSA